jgi:2-isopropylmalate synthase
MPKYKVIEPIKIENRQWPDKQITSSPRWCAVDLRDGNQALPNPLTLEEKKEYYLLLLEIGFKEIEVGFPSASKDDFDFCRWLVEEDQIPADVMISVLAPSRPDLIIRTMEALKGYKEALVHIYVATCDLHRVHVLGKTEDDTIEIVRSSIAAIKKCASEQPETRFFLEFSPEEFTDTDLDFAIKICDDVVDQWDPVEGEKVILNLPATVERRPPTHYADMIEVFIKKLRNIDKSVVSLHAHNDMGCAVASTQLALQAGAHRVEGTLFGHGERTGNVDLVTLIINLQYMGVETGIDFSNLIEVNEVISRLTKMRPHARHPYVGDLVFSAFSGSHQDAIHKCLARKEELAEVFGQWKIPYLHVDPTDFGRTFEKFIRINSQSGKGGIAHLIELEHHIKLPRLFQVVLAKRVQAYAEEVSREITSDELTEVFFKNFMSNEGDIELIKYWPYPDEEKPSKIHAKVKVKFKGEKHELKADGNGPISAFVKALKTLGLPKFKLETYDEDSIGDTSKAKAVTFVTLKKSSNGETFLGVGTHNNIDQAAVLAVVAALNNLLQDG